jgi:5-oxoprolinase (ATP-hydrolysing)
LTRGYITERHFSLVFIPSGPAGGVVGYGSTTYGRETARAVIGFDMGGTSTDVSRFDGSYEHVFETTTAGVTIQAPQLDVSTVAAGGGSILTFRSGLFAAGPESAGAHPGPVCYRKGGPVTITDANLVLGRLLPSYFPKIFGPDENESLDKEAAFAAFKILKDDVNEFMGGHLSVEEVAMGFVKVANETMCRPIRNLTQGKGYDTREHVLACFGGAGGQHACSIARALGMSTVYIHKYAGILSAYGMALADVIHEEQVPSAMEYNQDNLVRLEAELDGLQDKCEAALLGQGFAKAQIKSERYLHMRYQGTDCALMCSSSNEDDFMTAFLKRYKTEFGFTLQNRAVFVDDVRVRGIGCTDFSQEADLTRSSIVCPNHVEVVQVFFDTKYESTKVVMGSNNGLTVPISLAQHLFLHGKSYFWPKFFIQPPETQ